MNMEESEQRTKSRGKFHALRPTSCLAENACAAVFPIRLRGVASLLVCLVSPVRACCARVYWSPDSAADSETFAPCRGRSVRLAIRSLDASSNSQIMTAEVGLEGLGALAMRHYHCSGNIRNWKCSFDRSEDLLPRLARSSRRSRRASGSALSDHTATDARFISRYQHQWNVSDGGTLLEKEL
jgi:hypothetical protein